jgi:hypothetical protein
MFTVNEESDNSLAYIIDSSNSDIVGYVHDGRDEKNSQDILDLGLKKQAFFFPNVTRRFVWFIAGSSGSGKSTYIRNTCMLYQNLYPKRNVYIFSSKKEDPSLDKYKKANYGQIEGKLEFSQIDMNEDSLGLLSEEYILERFKNCIVIFDDVILASNKLQRSFDTVAKLFIELGRQNNISVLVSRQELMDMRNKQIKSSCDSTVIFPNSSFKKHIFDYIKSIGISKESQSNIFNTKDRWVFLHTHCPLFGLTNSRVFPIN